MHKLGCACVESEVATACFFVLVPARRLIHCGNLPSLKLASLYAQKMYALRVLEGVNHVFVLCRVLKQEMHVFYLCSTRVQMSDKWGFDQLRY
jgi:hypothetical protein